MSNCCGKAGRKEAQSPSCCAPAGKTVLLYACSGGANVAEISDKAARELMFSGCGSMFCLAGLGAGIPEMIQAAKDADVNLVIDGCPVDCAKKVFEKAGLKNCLCIRVTDLGIEKIKGVRCTEEQVAQVVECAKKTLSGKK
jgi:uncharacterized metal-binding protein